MGVAHDVGISVGIICAILFIILVVLICVLVLVILKRKSVSVLSKKDLHTGDDIVLTNKGLDSGTIQETNH